MSRRLIRGHPLRRFYFISVGAEWFLMWQSQTWNGQDAAMRMFLIMGTSLIFLQMRDDELPAAG